MNFSINRKTFKRCYPMKSLNSFLYTLNISFSIIPNFMKMAHGTGNTNVSFLKNDIIMTFFKYSKVNTIV